MEYRVIGLMSGTSMDGLDIAFCRFKLIDGKWSFSILNAETIPYSKNWLLDLNTARKLSDSELKVLDERYGVYLGEKTLEFIENNKLSDINFISSHGHTVHHKPEDGITVQIGNGQVFSDIVQMPVIYDFRTKDVNLGGQGAPLVPIGDELLFKENDACLNLGGFANISFNRNDIRHAFDICPVNIVMNYVTRKIGLAYDHDGEIAKSGVLDFNLLNVLNAIPFYEMPYPKSLGIEWVEKDFYPLINEVLKPEDLLRTIVSHSVCQINKVIEKNGISNVLVTGGGAFNVFLINELKKKSDAKILLPNANTINYKEALVFALLGVLKMHGEINILKSVTGASKDHCSGIVAFPSGA
jgi:anhydro-N-acetylmuramic acid kinase